MNQYTVESSIRVTSRKIGAHEIEKRIGFSGGKLVEPKVAGDEARVIVESDFDDTESVENHLLHICTKLEQNRQAISSLPPDAEIDVWCIVYAKEEFTGFVIDKNLLGRFSTLPVNLYFSVYENSNDG